MTDTTCTHHRRPAPDGECRFPSITINYVDDDGGEVEEWCRTCGQFRLGVFHWGKWQDDKTVAAQPVLDADPG